MTKLAANLTMLFNEFEFPDRFGRAAANGFTGVEVLFPYQLSPSDIETRLSDHNLELVLFNLPAGDWDAGERGLASDPDRKEEFRDGVDLAANYAGILNAPHINCLVGKTTDAKSTRQTMLDNILYAADTLANTNARLLIEPVNLHDVPGFAINTTDEALAVIDELDHPNVGLQFDVYHSMRMDEDPFVIIAERGKDIDHIQIADVPGRHQPGTGEIDFRKLFDAIDESGYTGWVSLEYVPDGATEDGFDHVRELGVLGQRREES